MVYNVDTPDGHIAEYISNIIAENLYSQVYRDGYNRNILCEIVGHRKIDDTIPMENRYYDTIT